MLVQAVTLQVARADVAEQLKRGNTGALARIWQVQQEKEEAWMRSLLEGLEVDDQYINAKREIAAAMGLRAEEVEDELEVQELEDLHGWLNEVRAWAWICSASSISRMGGLCACPYRGTTTGACSPVPRSLRHCCARSKATKQRALLRPIQRGA